MDEDSATDVHVNLDADDAQRANIALERAIATNGLDFDAIELRNLLSDLRNGMIAAGHDPVTDYVERDPIEYSISVTNIFEATSPEDAVVQMALWLNEHALQAGYRVKSVVDGTDALIDAETIDFNKVSEA